MIKDRKTQLLISFLLIPFILFGGFIFMLTYYDPAFYHSNGVNLGSPEYYTHALSITKGAGYYYSINDGPGGVNPGFIEGLDPRLGSDFRVNSMDLYNSNSSWFLISFSIMEIQPFPSGVKTLLHSTSRKISLRENGWSKNSKSCMA